MKSTQVGGLAWVIGTLQYAVCQVLVARAYAGHYSLRDNYISDLGNTACGLFAVPHGVPVEVCSPAHAVMNASFVVIGVLTAVGAVLLRPLWPAGPLATTGTALWVVAGIGKVVVGLVPENADAALHLLGAFNIPLGSVAILLLSAAVGRRAPVLAGFGVVLAVLGLVGTVLSTAGQFAPALHLGLGSGGAERLAGYPGNLWMLVVGLLAAVARGPAIRPEPEHRRGHLVRGGGRDRGGRLLEHEQSRSGNLARECLAVADGEERVLPTVHHEHRERDRG